MTDDELRGLLRQILELALRGFSYPHRNDMQLVAALGRIAGTAAAALK